VTVYEEVWFPCFPREWREWREARVAMAKIAWFRNWSLGLSEMSSGMKGSDDGGAAGQQCNTRNGGGQGRAASERGLAWPA
jgi:hypothetical protein